MAKQDWDWLGWGIDYVRYWLRKGGSFAAALLFFTWFMGFAEGIPPGVRLATGAVGAALFLLSTIRTLPGVRISFSGQPLTGRVINTEERTNYFRRRERSNVKESRVFYSFELDGAQYNGDTEWLSHKTCRALKPGDEIALIVDPEQPGAPYAVFEIPSGWPVPNT